MVFILSALWWRRIRGSWKLPDGRDWWRGKLGLVLMGRAVLSKSLIQFSVVGWGCVPSLLFDLRPNYGGGNEDNGDRLQKVPWCTAAHSVPNPEAGHCRSLPLPETPRYSWASLDQSLVGSLLSFLLGPGTHKLLLVPSKSLFPSLVSVLAALWVGLMVISSKRAYAIPRSTAPRAPAPAAVHCWPVPM